MKCQHVNPEDAVQVHEDVRAKKSLAIHWGTFNLSYEVSPRANCFRNWFGFASGLKTQAGRYKCAS